MQSQPECFSSLNYDQQIALAETDSRIDWLLKEETMHGLLKTPVITLSTLKYVEKQLQKNNPYVDNPSSIIIPFQFVKNWSESRLIFMEQLEKDGCCKKNGKYQLKRLGDYFYVSEDSIYNIGDEQSYSNSASPIVPEGSSVPPSATSNIDQSNDFCDGLGISISQFSEREEMEEEEDTLIEETSIPTKKRPLYWLILKPHEKYIQIYFYSKIHSLTAGSDILNPVREKIKIVQERTNRLSLLNHLQETRLCSKYLEAPGVDVRTTISSDEDESDEEGSNETVPEACNTICKFEPNQFACPIVFTKRLPLHWRLQPNVASKYLSTDVLRLFTVVNRPGMYVIERDNSIVYCKIHEETIDSESESSPNTVYGSPVQTLSGKNTEDDNQTLVAFSTSESKRDLTKVSSTSPRPRGTNNSRPSSTEKREIVIEVYGIELPPWVEREFLNMIENRLVSQITLNEIQQYFTRNSTSKPTLAVSVIFYHAFK